MDTLRILHLADVHLGAKFAFLKEKANLQRDALRTSFKKAAEKAIEENVQFFLVVGDLFDSPIPSKRDLFLVEEEFNRLANKGIQIVLLPGTHDLLSETSVFREAPLSQITNLFIFNNPEIYHRIYLQHGLTIYAQPNLTKRSSESPLDKFHLQEKTTYHLGLAHGSIKIPEKTAEDDFPISLKEIEESGLDYLALGHWHGLSDFSQGKTKAFYPGSLEPLSFDQQKTGFVLLVTLSSSGTQVTPIKVGKKEFISNEIDLGKLKKLAALKEEILKGAHENLIKEIKLKGIVDLVGGVNPKDLEEELQDQFFQLKIIDHSQKRWVDFDESIFPEKLISGQFVRILKEAKEKIEKEEDKKALEEALQLGISLLKGEEVL